MTFIIASLQLILWFAYMILLMFAAYGLAMYVIGAVVELCMAASTQGWKTLWHNPIRTIKDMHTAGVDVVLMRNNRFAMV